MIHCLYSRCAGYSSGEHSVQLPFVELSGNVDSAEWRAGCDYSELFSRSPSKGKFSVAFCLGFLFSPIARSTTSEKGFSHKLAVVESFLLHFGSPDPKAARVKHKKRTRPASKKTRKTSTVNLNTFFRKGSFRQKLNLAASPNIHPVMK